MLCTGLGCRQQVLLADILIRSRLIAQGYASHVVEPASGGRLDGVPGDLEKQIDGQQMAALLAYLKEGE